MRWRRRSAELPPLQPASVLPAALGPVCRCHHVARAHCSSTRRETAASEACGSARHRSATLWQPHSAAQSLLQAQLHRQRLPHWALRLPQAAGLQVHRRPSDGWVRQSQALRGAGSRPSPAAPLPLPRLRAAGRSPRSLLPWAVTVAPLGPRPLPLPLAVRRCHSGPSVQSLLHCAALLTRWALRRHSVALLPSAPTSPPRCSRCTSTTRQAPQPRAASG